MNPRLINIINKQQEYEYLKTRLRENNDAYKSPLPYSAYGNLKSPYLENIKHNIALLVSKQRKIRLKYFISGIAFLLMLGISGIRAGIELIDTRFYPETAYPSEFLYLPAYQIQIALDNNALLTAEIMLDEQLEKDPDNYDIYPLYIQFCEKKGKYDEAIEYMLTYLTEYIKIENINSENSYYRKLIDYEYPISDESRQKIDEFMKEYEYSILTNNSSENEN